MGDFFDQEYFDIDQLLMEETMMQANEEQQQQQQQNHQNQQQQDAAGGDYNEDDDDSDNEFEFQTQNRGRKQLSEQEKRILADEIMVNITDGKLPWGFLSKLAQKYRLHKATTTRLFSHIKEQMTEGQQLDFSSNKKDEDDPYRPQQSKRFKVKAMFEAMIGKPLYDGEGTLLHSGKYGIFPFVNKVVMAVRNSKNGRAGTWETKTVQSVTKVETRRMLLDDIIPAIQENWPPSLAKDVYMQWNNDKPHQIPTDEEFVAACTANGFNIQMIFQPPQSPDLNVLDLGLFRLIHSLQYETFPTTLDELIENVQQAYDNFDPTLFEQVHMNHSLKLHE